MGNNQQPLNDAVCPNSISQQIMMISKLSATDKECGIELLHGIFANILNDPTNIKYHSINSIRLSKKLKYEAFIEILVAAGFNKSSDRQRLLFDHTKLETLSEMNEIVMKNKLQNTYHTSHQQVSMFQRTMNVFKPSFDFLVSGRNEPDKKSCNDCEENQTDIQKLVKMKFTNAEAEAALNKHSNIDVAVEYLSANADIEAEEKRCNGIYENVTDCVHLKKMVSLLDEYRNGGDGIDNKNTGYYVEISKILKRFYHLLTDHNSDYEFQMIHNQLIPCDIKQCKAFKRNYRDRNRVNANNDIKSLYETSNDNSLAALQILDTIHCFYHHSYNVGHRISANKLDEKKHDIDFHSISCRNNKFNQLPNNAVEHKNDSNQATYSFGTKFVYEIQLPKRNVLWRRLRNDGSSIVIQKWKNLKEELTQNEIFVVTIEQFSIEFIKTAVKYSSVYRRANFTELTKQQALACMLYCNYDGLQAKFSETYYLNIAKHNEFWHFGNTLKIEATYRGFGKQPMLNLYHGLSKKLFFPAYLQCNIWSPLSTTTCLAVAMNFSNDNQGLIIQFNVTERRLCQYLSVNWLSDFPGENEHLFVQSAKKLQIIDIIDPSADKYYKDLLKAILILNQLTWGLRWDEAVSPLIQSLIVAIVRHQLSKYHTEKNLYKPFESLNEYGQQMLNVFYENRETNVGYVEFDYVHIKEKHEYLSKLLFHDHMDWIKMDVVDALFSNLKVDTNKYGGGGVVFRSVCLCDNIFEDILMHYSKVKFNRIRFMRTGVKGELSSTAAYKKYKDIFEQKNIRINKPCGDYETVAICWKLCSKNTQRLKF